MFAGVILGTLLLGIFLAIGAAITFKPIAGLWICAGLIAWLAFLVFVVSPYRIWKQSQEKITELEGQLTPKLGITFGADRIYHERHNGEISVRIGVKNLSRSITANGVELTLANIVSVDEEAPHDVNLLLSSNEANTRIAINPGVIKYYLIGVVIKKDTGSIFFNTCDISLPLHNNKKYQFRFDVSAESSRSQTAVFLARLNEEGNFVLTDQRAESDGTR